MGVPLRWAGSKRRMIESYQPYLPTSINGRFWEPMCGSAVLSLDWAASRCLGLVLGDSNPALMGFYAQLQDHVEHVITSYEWLGGQYEKLPPHEQPVWYYQMRDHFNEVGHGTVTSSFMAGVFLALNKLSFNGLWRVDRAGRFNVPFNKKTSLKVEGLTDSMRAVAKKLKEAVLLPASDYEQHLTGAGRPHAGDVVYFDPPFDESFSTYTKKDFDKVEQARLAMVVRKLDAEAVTVYVANSDTPLIRNLYNGFTIIDLWSPRSISCKGDGRKKVPELLITNA